MGSSSSKLKSSKLFKRASFRRGSKKKHKEQQQANGVHLHSNGAVQNGQSTNEVLANGNGNLNSAPAICLQPPDQPQEPLEPSPSPSPSSAAATPSSPQPPSSSSLSPSPSPSPSPNELIITENSTATESSSLKNGHNHQKESAYSTLNLPTTTSTPKLQRASKRKSRSIGHLLRRTASMKGGTSTVTSASPSDATDSNDETLLASERSKSTFSLSKRFSSLKSIGSFRRFRQSRSSRKLQAELAKAEAEELAALEALFKHNPAEVPPPGEECYFSSLYEHKLHQKVFCYLNLKERISLRAVCKRWQIELLKESPTFVYPLFAVPERQVEPEMIEIDHHWEAQQATSASNRHLYYAANVQKLLVKGRLTRGTLENLVKYCFSKLLTSIEFRASAESERCDIISTSVLEAFSARFGPMLQEVTVTTAAPSSELPLQSKNNDLTDVILFLLYTNSEHFASLAHFGCSIGNKLSNGYFQMFQSEFGAQLRHLTLELKFDAPAFTAEAAKTLERIGSTMEGLISLSLALLPRPSATLAGNKELSSSTSTRTKNNLLLLGPLLELISQLPNRMTRLTSFSLAIDVVSAEIADLSDHNLDFLQSLSHFTKAKFLSLTLYGDLKAMEGCPSLRLNFDQLSQNKKLKKFHLDCSKVSDQDTGRLVRALGPQLTELRLGVDVRVTGAALVDQISRHLPELQKLEVRQSYGSLLSPPSERKTSARTSTSSKEALFIDSEALASLLLSAPLSLPKLRSISLENCRIDMEDIKVLDVLVTFACHQPDQQFSISLAHNRFPLTVVPKYRQKYRDYLPENLTLSWR